MGNITIISVVMQSQFDFTPESFGAIDDGRVGKGVVFVVSTCVPQQLPVGDLHASVHNDLYGMFALWKKVAKVRVQGL